MSQDSPICAKARLKPALAATIRKSARNANEAPAPAATPLTAATTGLSIVCSRVAIGL